MCECPSESPASYAPPAARSERGRRVWLLASALAALAVALWTGHAALQSRSDRTYVESFSSDRIEIPGDPDGFQSRGWAGAVPSDGSRALALAPGGRGLVGYRFPFDRGEQAVVRLRVRSDSTVRTRLILQTEGRKLKGFSAPAAPLGETLVDWRLDLTPYLTRGHDFHLTIECRRAAEPRTPTTVVAYAGGSFEFRSSPWRPVDPVGAAFFLGVLFLLWWALMVFIAPAAFGGLLVMIRARRTARGRMARVVAVLAPWVLLLLIVLIAQHPSWREHKKHDDLWAIGNSRLLVLRRFDPHDLFFRSRIRPAFPALVLPFMVGLDYRMATVSTTPSDFHKRLFYVYDRTGATAGQRIFPELSLFALCLLALALGMLPALWMSMDRGWGSPLRASLAALFAAVFWLGALNTPQFNVITLSCTWVFQLAAMLAFVRALRSEGRFGDWAAAGVLVGLAVLFKESAVALVLPIAVFGVWRLVARRAGVRSWLGAAMGAAVALGLYGAYFASVLPGGFGELAEQFHEYLPSRDILEGYFLPSSGGIAGGLYEMFGLWLIPVVAGIVWQLTRYRRRPATHLAALWFVGACSVFVLPYFFSRFLIYMIPAAGWFVGASAADALCLATKSKSPRP